MSAVKEILDYISKAEQTYLKMPKKHKKEVDAILTATTLIKMKCKQAKELEEKQRDDFAIGFAEWIFKNKGNMELYTITSIDNSYILKSTKELLEIYKKENL